MTNLTNLTNVLERLPIIIKELQSVSTQYTSDSKSIGEACGYLRVLQDLLIQFKDAK